MLNSRKGARLIAAVAVLGLVITACGGGKKASNASRTGNQAAEESTTTTAVGDTSTTDSTLASGATSTTVVAGNSTATTTKTTRTTAKASTKPAIKNLTAPPPTVGGIANVQSPTSAASGEQPTPGGTLTVLLNLEFEGPDPTKATGSIGGSSPHRLFALYDTLVWQDAKSGNVVPSTLASMTSTDGTTWLMKVRNGIKFTDGTTYDAAAIKYNWDRCLDPATACSNAATMAAMTYDAIDPLTLKVVLKQPNSQFPRIISAGGSIGAIASPTALKAAGSQANYLNGTPVGAGPFMWKSWTRDSQLVMVRNPNYWNAPRPYVDQLIFKPIVNEEQRTSSFKAGEAQLEFVTTTPTAADLSTKYQVLSAPSINIGIEMFNVARPPFNDVRVRKAIQLVIDRDKINKTVYNGVLDTPNSYFPSNYPYYDPSLKLPDVDVAAAQKLIDEVYASNGNQDIVFTWTSGNSSAQSAQSQLAQQMVQQLKHVKMNLKIQSSVQSTQDIKDKNFDAISTVITGPDPEPQFLGTVRTGAARAALFTGYSNAKVDKAVDDSRAAIDANTRNAALKAMQAALLDDPAFLVVYRNPYFFAAQPEVRGLETFDEGGLLSDRVWLKQ
jgi:peptide/nickel transport system substrate-binding protein